MFGSCVDAETGRVQRARWRDNEVSGIQCSFWCYSV